MANLAVEALEGFVGSHPEETIQHLADIAHAEGFDRETWLAKAAVAAGATRVGVAVGGEPRYAIVPEVVAQADAVFQALMAHAVQDIVALIRERGPDAAA